VTLRWLQLTCGLILLLGSARILMPQVVAAALSLAAPPGATPGRAGVC
jgi:hypothetical protein